MIFYLDYFEAWYTSKPTSKQRRGSTAELTPKFTIHHPRCPPSPSSHTTAHTPLLLAASLHGRPHQASSSQSPSLISRSLLRNETPKTLERTMRRSRLQGRRLRKPTPQRQWSRRSRHGAMEVDKQSVGVEGVLGV